MGPRWRRVIGARGNDDAALNTATTPIAEFYGVMIGQDRRTDQLASPTDMFRGYSAVRRDRAPLIETEDFRDEGARRFWDDFSPPYFGFKKGPNDTWQYTSESFALAAVARYRLIGITAFPTPTRLTPSGRVTPPSISPIPMPMDARIRARSAASAARWMPFACPKRSISPTASCRTSSPTSISWAIGVIRRRP